MSEQQHTCPRRVEDGRADPNSPFTGSGTNLDTWLPGSPGPSCSYCGSLHPDRFMELVRDGWEVGPTDKSYKAYLRRSLTEEDEAQAKADWISRDRVAQAVREVGEQHGKTAEEIAADLDQQWNRYPHSSSGPEAKFYFQHLTGEQRDEFIALHNSGQMKIGYPGHFYQPPFFTRAGAA